MARNCKTYHGSKYVSKTVRKTTKGINKKGIFYKTNNLLSSAKHPSETGFNGFCGKGITIAKN